MNPSAMNPTSYHRHGAFTLVELLVVLAIIAVVGSGIAVTYGRKNVEEAKARMTLHEMGEIKKAFLNFENDNYRRLRRPLEDHLGNALPHPAYAASFAAGHVADSQLEARMQLYETYGLWFLMLPKVYNVGADAQDADGQGFPDFGAYDGLAGEGWNGPYLDVTSRSAWTYDGVAFPQIADKYDGRAVVDGNPTDVYRLLYFEHSEAPGDAAFPVYRRLLLVAPRDNAGFDTHAELLAETGGSLRGGGRGRLNLQSGAFENNESSPYFVLELINLDVLPQ